MNQSVFFSRARRTISWERAQLGAENIEKVGMCEALETKWNCTGDSGDIREDEETGYHHLSRWLLPEVCLCLCLFCYSIGIVNARFVPSEPECQECQEWSIAIDAQPGL